ncbi:hypothetical protein AB9P05_17005 [Roseivirga sp. BDSF3-8]|uniref:hypothetical protein n=1 Tax=Roseivirga sp. BDSF3-8 TaxID=3241598 RepID=UPI0035318276
MNKLYRYSRVAFALLFAATACTYDFPETTEPDSGDLSLEKYVAVGNSITAGFMDAALYNRGQENSYPNILANQFRLVGGGEFTQPDIMSENGFAPQLSDPANGVILGRLKLNSAQQPEPLEGEFPLAEYNGDVADLNNFGVPGIITGQLFDPRLGDPAFIGTPLFNPYYARIASSPGSSTLLDDAVTSLENGGTFFTLWIGNNDVLGYALTGASNEALLTDELVFGQQIDLALERLTNVPGVRGVVANIPDVTRTPYFTTIDSAFIPLAQANVDALRAGYEDFNNGVAAYNAQVNANPDLSDEEKEALRRPSLSWTPGLNPPVIIDEDLPTVILPTPDGNIELPKYRMLTGSDYVLLSLPQDSVANGLGTMVPMSDQFILTETEAENIRSVIEGFNGIIESLVPENDQQVRLIDMYDIFNNFYENGANLGGIPLTNELAPPYGGFSLDGVHTNGRGSAFIANQFIQTINSGFGASITLVNPNNYPGNDLPGL